MKLSFQSYYGFEIGIGSILLIYGGKLLTSNLAVGLISIFLGAFLIYDGISRWNNRLKNEEKLTELDVKRKDATLDFDIKEIDGENDDDFEPDDFEEDGTPIGMKIFTVVSLKINIVVYNPCLIENAVRSIEVSIKRKNKTKVLEVTDFSPLTIPPRKYVPIIFKGGGRDFQGRRDDKIEVCIKTMDNKIIKQEKDIKYYSTGPNRRQAEP